MSGFSPYAIFRRGTTSFNAVSRITPHESWDIVNRVAEIDDALEVEAEQVSARLYDAVPQIDDRKLRAYVLKLRRQIHNGELSIAATRESIHQKIPQLTPSLTRWLDLAEDRFKMAEHLSNTFAAEIADGKKVLRDEVSKTSFLRALELSGEQLYNDTLRYIHEGDLPERRDNKNIESTLISYVYRVALKPSPFSSFAHVGAIHFGDTQTWDSLGAKPGVTVNRIVLRWIENAVEKTADAESVFYAYINNSVHMIKNMIVFIGSDTGQPVSPIPGQKLLAVRRSAVTDVVLDCLSNGAPVKLSSLLDRMMRELDISRPEADRLIAGFRRVGLISVGFALPDQLVDPATCLLQRFELVGVDKSSAHYEMVRALAMLESEFGSVPDDSRTVLLSSTRQAMTELASSSSISRPPPEFVRSLVFEDVPAVEAPITWNEKVLHDTQSAFEATLRLASVLDPGPMRRLGLYALYASVFPEKKEVSFLDFFAAFSKTSERDFREFLHKNDSDRLAALEEARRAGLSYVLEAPLCKDGRRLNSKQISDLLSPYSDMLPLVDSATFRIQITHDPNTMNSFPILNGVHTGYGAFFSRFGSFLRSSDQNRWDLAKGVSCFLQRTRPRQVDLTAVLGLNFNLHPKLVKRSVTYPGCIAVSPDSSMTLGQLVIVPDHGHHQVLIKDRTSDEVFQFVPMNFLIPVGVPPLYQLLLGLSPTLHYRLDLWSDAVEASSVTDAGHTVPRLSIDELVIERAGRRFKASEIPELDGLAAQNIDALIAFERWRHQNGVPQHSFFLVQDLRDSRILSGKESLPKNDFKYLSELRRASSHKPHYLDTRNPFLMRVFARAVARKPEAIVTFRECLPDVETYGEGSTLESAEEFFVEYNF